jgi:hypothetical protein
MNVPTEDSGKCPKYVRLKRNTEFMHVVVYAVTAVYSAEH